MPRALQDLLGRPLLDQEPDVHRAAEVVRHEAGPAPGFADQVAMQLEQHVPFVPEIGVGALREDAVVEGFLAARRRGATEARCRGGRMDR
jgi:hypothetical protein